MPATTQTHELTLPIGRAADDRARPHRSRLLTATLWTFSLATAGLFAFGGYQKLTGAPMMVQLFDLIGVGQWFRYVTGGIEVSAAVAVLIPAIAAYGALTLAVTMVGAILTHLIVLGDSPAMPAAFLLVTASIAWARWSWR